jgi:hypothetical protein
LVRIEHAQIAVHIAKVILLRQRFNIDNGLIAMVERIDRRLVPAPAMAGRFFCVKKSGGINIFSGFIF